MGGEFSDRKCPKCGSTLLIDGDNYWCSFIGGEGRPSCDYGISTPVIRQELDAISKDRRQQHAAPTSDTTSEPSRAIYWRCVAQGLGLAYRALDGVTVEFLGDVSWLKSFLTVNEMDSRSAYRRCRSDGSWLSDNAELSIPNASRCTNIQAILNLLGASYATVTQMEGNGYRLSARQIVDFQVDESMEGVTLVNHVVRQLADLHRIQIDEYRRFVDADGLRAS